MAKEKELEAVALIASGYEWICLDCDTFHKIIETADFVTCSECGKKFVVSEAFHAHPW